MVRLSRLFGDDYRLESYDILPHQSADVRQLTDQLFVTVVIFNSVYEFELASR